MNFFRTIQQLFNSQPATTMDFSPTFPYSDDPIVKREEVWRNLQKGMHFEDTGTYLPWSTPFAEIDKIAEERTDSGDRTNWFLGKHLILDGYESYVSVMRWIWIPLKESFMQIDEFLGFDNEGNEKFNVLATKLVNLLGEPTLQEIEKFGSFDLGTIQWLNGDVQITLTGIEQFACKYRLHVGLVRVEGR